MYRVAEVQMRNQLGNISGVVVDIMTVTNLRRAAMASTIVGDHAIALIKEVKHLRVPIICAQWPAVMENNRLTRAPILIENIDTVFRSDCAHSCVLPLDCGVTVVGRRSNKRR